MDRKTTWHLESQPSSFFHGFDLKWRNGIGFKILVTKNLPRKSSKASIQEKNHAEGRCRGWRGLCSGCCGSWFGFASLLRMLVANEGLGESRSLNMYAPWKLTISPENRRFEDDSCPFKNGSELQGRPSLIFGEWSNVILVVTLGGEEGWSKSWWWAPFDPCNLFLYEFMKLPGL